MLKLIYQSLQKRKGKSILLMVQFTIGFSALLFGLSCIDNVFQYRRNVERLASLDSVHAYFSYDSLEEVTPKMIEGYKEIFKKVKELGVLKRWGMFEEISVYEDIKATSQESNVYILNQDMLEMSNFKLQKGSAERLAGEFSKNDIIPVIISASMEQQYKMGDTYSLYYNDIFVEEQKIKIEIVGVLDSTLCFWSGGGSTISENMTSNTKFILAPQFKEFESNITYANNSLFTFFENDNNKEDNIEKVKQRFSENGISLHCITLKEEVDSYYERQKVVIISTTVFSAIILILSLLGCIGSVLASITVRYKEFGIYYSLGFTKKNMISLVGGEIAAIFSISFILALLICKAFFTLCLAGEGFAIRFSIISIAFLIMTVCIALCIMMPIIKLKNVEPIELLNGREK